MARLLTATTAVIVAFAVARGGYKLAGGEADLRIFAALGISPLAVLGASPRATDAAIERMVDGHPVGSRRLD